MTVNTSVAADHNAPPVTAQLAQFVAEHPSQGWDASVDHEAHRTFLNWLGCAIGAARHEAVADAAMISGAMNLVSEEPALPAPKMPIAVPCSLFGKKMLVDGMYDEKSPPPMPHKKPMTMNVAQEVFRSWIA